MNGRLQLLCLILLGAVAPTVAEPSDLLDTRRWHDRTYGISLLPPVGSKMLSQTGSDYLLQIVSQDKTYRMTVAVQRSKRPLSLTAVHNTALMQIADAHRAARIISDDEAEFAGQPGRRIVFAAPVAGKKTALIAQAFVQVTPTTYLVINGHGEWKNQKSIMPVFDAVMGSVQIADQAELAKKRAQAIARTEAWRKKLGEDYLKKLPKLDHYYRLLADKDDIGWMRVTSDTGDFNNAQGLRVSVTTHVKLTGARVDSTAEYFVPFDTAVGEAWTIRTTVRQSKPGIEPRTSVETGSGSLASIDVRLDGSGGAQSKPMKFTRPPHGYLPQVEAWVLQYLLPRDAAGEYGFYWYSSADGRIVYRYDRVTPMLTGYVITSTPNLNAQPLRATYDQDGTLIRNELGGNRTLVQSNLKELQSIWRMR